MELTIKELVMHPLQLIDTDIFDRVSLRGLQGIADRIALIFYSLYSRENEKEWEEQNGKGLTDLVRN